VLRRRRSLSSWLRRLLGDELYERLLEYSSRRGVSQEDALRDLVAKGLRYYELEKAYGKRVSDREVWDRRFYFMKVEAGYLRYKLRLREVVEDIRRVLMVLSSTVSELQTCSGVDERLVEELRGFVSEYMRRYIFAGREETGSEEVSDAEVLESVKEVVKRYEALLHPETRSSSPHSRSVDT